MGYSSTWNYIPRYLMQVLGACCRLSMLLNPSAPVLSRQMKIRERMDKHRPQGKPWTVVRTMPLS